MHISDEFFEKAQRKAEERWQKIENKKSTLPKADEFEQHFAEDLKAFEYALKAANHVSRFFGTREVLTGYKIDNDELIYGIAGQGWGGHADVFFEFKVKEDGYYLQKQNLKALPAEQGPLDLTTLKEKLEETIDQLGPKMRKKYDGYQKHKWQRKPREILASL